MRRSYLFVLPVIALVLASASPAMAGHYDHGKRHGHGKHYGHHHHKSHHKKGANFVIFKPSPRYIHKPYVYYYPVTHTVYQSSPAVVQSKTIIIKDSPTVMASIDYCREYQVMTKVGGITRDSYGTACLQPDGSWKIVN